MGNSEYRYLFLILVLWQIYQLLHSTVHLEVVSSDIDNALPAKPSSSTATSVRSSITEPIVPMSIPPSKMKVHYHEMWNHSTSTIKIPEEYKNPFNLTVKDKEGNPRRPLTSLEILQQVLHEKEYEAEFRAVEDYMEALLNTSGTPPVPPGCLAPDLESTRKLAERTVKARTNKKESTKGGEMVDWTMPLPIMNVGFPKVGSNTLNDYFNCIGLKARHSQQGKQMFEQLAKGEGVYNKTHNVLAFTQLDVNTKFGYYPQISLLDELHEEYPNSTLIFNFRPIDNWINSTRGWHEMFQRFSRFLMPGLVLTPKQLERNLLIHSNAAENLTAKQRRPIPLSKVQAAKWWCGHVLHLREYVKEYPSHLLIELDLYDNDGTEDLLYDLFRADAKEDEEEDANDNDGAGGSLGDSGGDNTDETTQAPPKTRKKCWGKKNTSQERKKLPKRRKRRRRKQQKPEKFSRR